MFKARWCGLLFGLILSSTGFAKPIRVAIIDSGLNETNVPICHGNYDYINNKPLVGFDDMGHGTYVAKTIAHYAGINYCFIIFKIFSLKQPQTSLLEQAIIGAINAKANVINLSLSNDPSMGNGYSADEHKAINLALSKGIKIFVAAGNSKLNLNKSCDAYPACYKDEDLVVVGSDHMSNYGDVVKIKEPYCFNKFCGTSASTAIATGKYLKELELKNNGF